MNSVKADFFYRKPLKKGESKPNFGLAEPDPQRPDHKSFEREVINARSKATSFKREGFKLLNHKSSVEDFYDDQSVASIYYLEMQELAKKESSADEVFIVSHITRNELEAQKGKRLGAHRLVHNDFTPNFSQTLKPIIENTTFTPSKISVFNLWRRFDEDGLDAPFAVCDSSTVSEEELIPTDLFNYLDGEEGFTVEIYQSSFNDQHQWYYYPKMKKDEVLMFKTFDSLEKPFLPTLHSAFDEPSLRKGVSPRESIEVRAICLFK